ncbi:MAG: hypothetical protein H8E21_11205 [Gammaproteobacteria bacterium]|nr:hypothetical protein [Gammaproteobacteria bacterium]
MKTVYLLFIITFLNPLYAVELFGVELTTATRDQFRVALKKSGAKVLKQTGVAGLYDTYLAGSLLHNAQQLHVGFTKGSKKFAFAEYEFYGLKQPELLFRLQAKYGLADTTKGKFLSDYTYRWQNGDVAIALYQDWAAHKTRLTYYIQDALVLLRQERVQNGRSLQGQASGFMEQAY